MGEAVGRYRDDDKDRDQYINIIQYLEVYGYDSDDAMIIMIIVFWRMG